MNGLRLPGIRIMEKPGLGLFNELEDAVCNLINEARSMKLVKEQQKWHLQLVRVLVWMPT